MTIYATQQIDDLGDTILSLWGLVLRNERNFRDLGAVPDFFGGDFIYRIAPYVECDQKKYPGARPSKVKCGEEIWLTIKQIVEQSSGKPYIIECDNVSAGLCAALRVTGEDPDARLRGIVLEDVAHIQVLSRGRVLDPSIQLGMKVSPEMRQFAYDLNNPTQYVF